MQRKDEERRRSVKTLVKEECANYDGPSGGCWIRELKKCSQLKTQSLTCKYFREAVLPMDKLLCAELMGADGIKTCSICGKPFRAASNRAKYCDACGKSQDKKNGAKRQKNFRDKKTGV